MRAGWFRLTTGVVAGTVALGLVVASAVSAHDVVAQEQATLLLDRAHQVMITAGVALQALQADLTTVLVAYEANGAGAFDLAGDALVHGGLFSGVGLVTTGAADTVAVGTGDLVVGQVLRGPEWKLLATSGNQLTGTGVVASGSRRLVGLSLGGSATPAGTVLVASLVAVPALVQVATSGPNPILQNIGGALYISPRPAGSSLVFSASQHEPPPGAVVVPLEVGTSTWSLAVWPTHPLVGRLTANLQWIVLAAGLLLWGLFVALLRSRLRESEKSRRLRATEARMAAFVDLAPTAFLVVDRAGSILMANDRIVDLCGYSREEIIGLPLDELVPRRDRAAHRVDWERYTSHPTSIPPDLTAELSGKRKDGSEFPISIGLAPLELDGEAYTALMITNETERRSMMAELRRAAHTDGLTGLPNRAGLQAYLAGAVEDDRYGGGGTGVGGMAVVIVDLDDFKEVNDTMGHEAGDEVLVAVAERFRQSVRDGEFVARLGGDEFVVIGSRPARDDLLDARVVDLLTDLSGRPITTGSLSVLMRATAGIAVAATVGPGTAGDLLRQADTALYTAKAGGKGRWARFDLAMEEALGKRFSLSQDLSRAIDNGELTLAYQPIVDLETLEMVEVEALLRWQDDHHGTVPPEAVVDVAESTGQISRLGAWVLAEACSQAVAWHRMGAPEHFTVAVNVSARQLTDGQLVGTVERVLEETGCWPGWIALEVTETCLIGDPEEAIAALHALDDLGVQLSLDDFGTGYSSLSYVLRLPLDTIKVDRSFLVGQTEFEHGPMLLAGICGITATLGLRSLAEGVETAEQLELVRSSGFHLAQGYLFGRPAGPEAITERFGRVDDVLLGDRG